MRRISTKIALPLILGLASIVAVACGQENPNPDGLGGSGGSTDIGDGEGGEPNTGGGNSDGTGGDTDGTGGGSGGGDGEGGEGGEGTGGGSGGTPIIDPGTNDLPDCPDAPNETVSGGLIDGEDCWDFTVCEGVKSEQFLNQCSGTCFQPFDNEARIEDFDGTLPPL